MTNPSNRMDSIARATVLPKVAKVMAEDSNVRRRYLLSENHIVGYGSFDRLWGRLEELLELGVGMGPRYIALSGVSGNGKSTILEQFANSHQGEVDGHRRTMPVLYVPVPPEGKVRNIQMRMLRLLGAMPNKKVDGGTLGALLYRTLPRFGVRMVILDEIQHSIDVTSLRERGVAYNFFKDLGNALRIPVVLSGMHRATTNMLKTDLQLRRRCGDVVLLEGWRYSTELADFLQDVEMTLPLRHQRNLDSDAMVQAIATYCDGTIDNIMLRIRQAACHVLGSEFECITPQVFEALGLRPTPDLVAGGNIGETARS